MGDDALSNEARRDETGTHVSFVIRAGTHMLDRKTTGWRDGLTAGAEIGVTGSIADRRDRLADGPGDTNRTLNSEFSEEQ